MATSDPYEGRLTAGPYEDRLDLEAPHLEFGVDRLCRTCEGSGFEHQTHKVGAIEPAVEHEDPERRVRCEHVCPTCLGNGLERRGAHL